MAKTDRQQKSPRQVRFVTLHKFHHLESAVFGLRDAIAHIRHESSDNLRRCGELQFQLDALKKATEREVSAFRF